MTTNSLWSPDVENLAVPNALRREQTMSMTVGKKWSPEVSSHISQVKNEASAVGVLATHSP
jgi:hypothetical protein